MTLDDRELTGEQHALVTLPPDRRLFLEGIAGAGKTTTGVHRMRHLLAQDSRLLILAPQRTLLQPYQAVLDPGGQATFVTMGGLARRMIEIFWPEVSAQAAFAAPDLPPVFLTMETAQYHMARVVRPLIEEQGYFDTLTINRNRLYSQILDNLNKAALIGFPHDEIAARLIAAWAGESSQHNIYQHAQEAGQRFRAYCLAHNLLDFSLQMEVFARFLFDNPLCRSYLTRTYRHLIADNIEEDTPVVHDLLEAWLPAFDSALLIYDDDAGYRRFLGADPSGARRLAAHCDTQARLTRSFVTQDALRALAQGIAAGMERADPMPIEADVLSVLDFAYLRDEGGESQDDGRPYPRYHPQMLDRVAGEIARLVHDEGCAPDDIVVLAPFLSDALRFALMNRLTAHGVPVRSHRPSRALREEPAALCLLTLAALAHPAWAICPDKYAVAYALMWAIEGMDLVRAQLLANVAYEQEEGRPQLRAFDRINSQVQDRITFLLGGRYTGLRGWLTYYAEQKTQPPLDHFLSRLFGEVLAQPGYGFHGDYEAAGVAANLIESARKFRQVMEVAAEDVELLGREYLTMVQEGVIAALYLRRWDDDAPAVLLAPAYTFLMRNRPVRYQFWLEVGSLGWWERLYQPLTQPYVLSRAWPSGRQWTDDDEFNARQETLYRLVLGLIRRCREKVYLGMSELDEQGNSQSGPLLQAINDVLRREA